MSKPIRPEPPKGLRDFQASYLAYGQYVTDLNDHITKLEAENADVRHKNHTLFDEVEKEREEKAELRDQRGHKHYLLTQAVELLRDARANAENWVDIDDFLSKMEDTHE
jgi:hypothetical protein